MLRTTTLLHHILLPLSNRLFSSGVSRNGSEEATTPAFRERAREPLIVKRDYSPFPECWLAPNFGHTFQFSLGTRYIIQIRTTISEHVHQRKVTAPRHHLRTHGPEALDFVH